MYTPDAMKMKDFEVISKFISSHNFGVLISSDLTATHLPFVFKANEGAQGTLYGHMARANAHWKTIKDKKALVIFSGPHGYISPTWYHHKPAVPTWNYAAAHCFGTFCLLGDHETDNVLQELVAQHEPELLLNKDLMPEDYQEKLRRAIVCFKVVVEDIHAKEKLGQQRKKEDQQNVYASLQKEPCPESLAHYMEHRNLGLGL